MFKFCVIFHFSFAGTFQYESTQPIQSFDVSNTRTIISNEPKSGNIPVNTEHSMNSLNGILSDSENDAELVLGTELFHSQIELNHRRSSIRKVCSIH